jgi:hypothetical protein
VSINTINQQLYVCTIFWESSLIPFETALIKFYMLRIKNVNCKFISRRIVSRSIGKIGMQFLSTFCLFQMTSHPGNLPARRRRPNRKRAPFFEGFCCCENTLLKIRNKTIREWLATFYILIIAVYTSCIYESVRPVREGVREEP